MTNAQRKEELRRKAALLPKAQADHLLEQFAEAGFIRQTRVEGRRRSYILTDKGRKTLRDEYQRIRAQARDYARLMGGEEDT